MSLTTSSGVFQSLVSRALRLGATSAYTVTVRHGSSIKHKQGRRPKHYGICKMDGSVVRRGTIIVKQFGVKWHPGLNVGMGRNCCLFALEDGRVYMTTEKCDPDWNHHFMRWFYADRKEQPDAPFYKTYFHVVPDEQSQAFKLVDNV